MPDHFLQDARLPAHRAEDLLNMSWQGERFCFQHCCPAGTAEQERLLSVL